MNFVIYLPHFISLTELRDYLETENRGGGDTQVYNVYTYLTRGIHNKP